MTRFARAKGSKASNERVYSDPTPWHEIKNQMLKKQKDIEEEKKRREAEEKRNENYKKFLKEREEEATNNTEWADFPESNNSTENGVSIKSKIITKQSKKNKDKKLKTKAVLALKEETEASSLKPNGMSNTVQNSELKLNGGKPKKKKLKIIQESEGKDSDVEHSKTENENGKKKKSKKSKSLQENNECVVQDTSETLNDKNEENPLLKKSESVVKKGKKNKRNKVPQKVDNEESAAQDATANEEEDDAPIEASSKIEIPKVDQCQKKKKKKIKAKKESDTEKNKPTKTEKKTVKPKRKEIDIDSLPEDAKKKILKKQEKRRKQLEKKKLKKQQNKELKENEEKSSNVSEETKTTEKKNNDKNTEKFKPKPFNKGPEKGPKPPKKTKLENGDFKRRKDVQTNKIMVNGNEVELEYFDGFPIKKEDAQNLIKLKKEMISKGLPRSEINRTLKLERRKAEKALAREKKKVCFNCRKFGHNLSDCPQLSKKDELVDAAGSGICFKCGSTEHTSFVCRVEKGQNFKFATCFICKEQGHISRQCPDNARGLYPKGGSCRVCGDVTHLKKDCPQFQEQQRKEEAKFHVDTIFDGNPDDLEPRNDVPKSTINSMKPKIIKF